MRGGDATVAMQYFGADDLPFYADLARTFPLATRWFCSCLGPTIPNRRFLVSGTAHGLIDDVSLRFEDYPPAGTIFDLLSASGVSWANYHDQPAWRSILPTLFGRRAQGLFERIKLILAGLLPGLEKPVGGELFFTADVYQRKLLATWHHSLPIARFFDQAQSGKLPAVCFVDPDFFSYSEENPQDVQVGESFVASVIEAVMASPCWLTTLLVRLHDEYGGYYDHVPPPAAPAPDDVLGRNLVDQHPLLAKLPFLRSLVRDLERVDAGPRTFENFGFRIPGVVVSPYAVPGEVNDTTFDHTSVLRLIEDIWNLPRLTRRDATANSPLPLLDLESAPAFAEPPVLHPPATPGAWRSASLTTGPRRARPQEIDDRSAERAVSGRSGVSSALYGKRFGVVSGLRAGDQCGTQTLGAKRPSCEAASDWRGGWQSSWEPRQAAAGACFVAAAGRDAAARLRHRFGVGAAGHPR